MTDTIVGRFVDRARRTPDREALRELAAGGASADAAMTWGEWARASRAFAAALVAAELPLHTPVAILGGNGFVWPIADLGTLMAAGVSVGIYPSAASVQLQALLFDSGAHVLVLDGNEAWRTAVAMAPVPPTLRHVIVHDIQTTARRLGGATVTTWTDWLARGTAVLGDAATVAALENRARSIDADDLAVLIYTSGSTGEPKGARLSHRYLMASAESVRATLGLGEDDSSLSFLPFAHAAERIFGLYTRVLCGMGAGLVREPVRVWDAARAFSPTVLGGVPRLFEKLYEALLAAAPRGDTEAEWSRALELGVTRSRLRRARQPIPAELERAWQAAVRPIREWLAGWVGAKVRLASSGGATLPPAIAESLDAIGVTVLGAYGLTEHLCVAFNRPDSYTFDGVGTAMPGTELRVAADGEIQVKRSALTFSGYHNLPAASAEAFTEDGGGAWLLTGDLGVVDADGVLRITGRKKELIALSGGKKVAPLAIEARLVADPWIAQAMCYGEGRKFLSALLCLRTPLVQEWAQARGIYCDGSELTDHPAVLARVQELLDRVNAQVASPEQIKRFLLLGRELSSEHGELTETMKVRRPVVAERFRTELEALYR